MQGDVAYVPGDVASDLRNDDELPAIGAIFLVTPSMGDIAAEATPGGQHALIAALPR